MQSGLVHGNNLSCLIEGCLNTDQAQGLRLNPDQFIKNLSWPIDFLSLNRPLVTQTSPSPHPWGCEPADYEAFPNCLELSAFKQNIYSPHIYHYQCSWVKNTSNFFATSYKLKKQYILGLNKHDKCEITLSTISIKNIVLHAKWTWEHAKKMYFKCFKVQKKQINAY